MNERRYPGINMLKTGNWLRSICRFRNMAVKELCDIMNLGSPQSIYGWFCGRTLPSLDNFYALSQIFCIPLDELIINQDEVIPKRFVEKVGPQNTRLMCYRIRFAI